MFADKNGRKRVRLQPAESSSHCCLYRTNTSVKQEWSQGPHEDSRIYALVDRIFEMSEKEYKEIYDKIVDIPIYRLNYNRIKKIMEGAE